MSICPFRFKYLFILFFQISIICYSQQSRYNFKFYETSLNEVIDEVSKVTKVNILFNPAILPLNVRITGTFNNLSIKQALDTFFRQTQVDYKFYKNDIVLFKKPVVLKESHRFSKPNTPIGAINEKQRAIITDTVTYSVITYDTIVTKLTNISKVIDYDTIKVFDTVKIVQKIFQPFIIYKPVKKAIGIGLSISQGGFKSTLRFANSINDSSGAIKSSLKEKNSKAICLSFIYRNKSWLIETGVNLTKLRYTFDYSNLVTEMVTRIDTTDKYYTSVIFGDTAWVYITEEKLIETFSTKNFFSDLTYQYISFPLLIGYNKVVKNFTFEFKGGIVFNYYLGSSGYYLTILPDNKFQVNKSKAPGSSYIFDIFGGVCVDYYINQNIQIFGQPFVSYTSLSGGGKSGLYNPNNFQFGFQVGLKYFFKI